MEPFDHSRDVPQPPGPASAPRRRQEDGAETRAQERREGSARRYDTLERELAERVRELEALRQMHGDLAERVERRTVALSVTNDLLFLEIAERKYWAKVLRESEARHRALLNAIPDAMVQIGRDGTLLACQIPDDCLSELSLGNGVQRKVDEVLPVDFARQLMEHIRRVLRTGDLQVFEYALPVEDGVRDLEIRVVVSGEAEALCIIRDVTERKRIELMKEEFVSVVSHELRTPLTSINGSLALMASGAMGELPEQAHAMIDIAYRNTERLVRLINDLLDIRKIESGRMSLDLQPVALIPLLVQVLEANEAYGARHGVSFAFDEDTPEVWIRADADRIMQVVTNLLSNASKFSPADGVVTVAVTRSTGDVRVGVTDHGPGVPEAFRDRIFEKFAQVDASNSRRGQGTGLGLSICKAIIERHGGRIGFDSEPGVATTFFFELPVYEA